MKFIDKTRIKVTAGKGGDGIISFRREAHVDKGGPDGGDGGDGGNIFFVGEPGMNTLYKFYFQKNIKGNNGVNGGRKNLYGANGKDVFVKVPLGTQVFENTKLIADVIDENAYLICKGGKGGKGNAKFKTAKNSAPRLSENGMPGESKQLELELKVLADVGFVGVPNAGKSSLLSVITNAKPKIANYEFTTIDPQLGMVEIFGETFVVADLPGLIKGAHAGKGMGIEFLKHIERCKIIAHIIDFSLDYQQIKDNYLMINKELASYKLNLGSKKTLIVANKIDLENANENIAHFKKEFKLELTPISALKQENLNELKAKLLQILKNALVEEVPNEQVKEAFISFDAPFKIEKQNNIFIISGSKVKYWYERIPLNSNDNLLRFNKILEKMGVWNELYNLGIKKLDTVKIYDYEFEWNE
ncbi:GTPase obg [Mycoplasmopsis californica]|uniref:GTPase Obg n=1 Tax=Mycoplasmopsis equigenitalium TaxID=114883 RepID=A0ABY5J3Z4_9BACT|nr:GTPase ObgE [Mycoplasmopsis equigenitalium]UUD36670.1 GTPase ObgE [Mycoplasmopsis equigenitalium]VEU69368.1 GTPase obg [Mycoplasmopsis californica]